MIYKLERSQILPISLEKAWEFFSRPENLNEITPDELSFKIITKVPGNVYEGLMIAYKVKPFPLVSFDWLTEITHVKAPHYFVDEQRIGPYKLWHHEHHFEACDGGVLMTDIVHYALPFGILGQLAHPMFIEKKLNRIFDYRYTTLENYFAKN